MAKTSIVIVPPKANIIDYDYVAFSFNNIFSQNDTFKIYRTNTGGRLNIPVKSTTQELTADVPGADGTYYFGSFIKQKVFDINFAFDNLNDKGLRALKRWLNYEDIAELWFAEEPYKVYSAKVASQPSLQVIPFEENGTRVYKGEGSVQFIAYWPYGHTPDLVEKLDGSTGDGKLISSYSDFRNFSDWQEASGITDELNGSNPGEVQAPFIATQLTVNENETISVGNMSITILQKCRELIWDSRTGMVSAMPINSEERIPMPYKGNSCGGMPVDDKPVITSPTVTVTYHYWYY